jgi:DNA primase
MSTDTINEIKQKLSIVDLIGRYVELKKSGNNYKGLCPFHGENTPSFMVSSELQIYKCFGCGEGGDVFSFFQKIEGVDFVTALDRLGDLAGVEIPKTSGAYNQADHRSIIYEINYVTAKFYNFLLTKHKLGAPGLKYIKGERNLSDSVISDFMLGYAPKTWDLLFSFLSKKKYSVQDMLDANVIIKKTHGVGYIDRFRGRIIFPFTGIDGKILGFNGRTIFNEQPKYINTASTQVFNKSTFLFGLNQAKVEIKKHGAVVVEGQMDVITAFKHGIQNVIASSGTSFTPGQLSILGRYTKNLIFCYDSDSAGVSAIYRGITLAEGQDFNVMVAPIPAKYTDLDQMLNKELQKAKDLLSNPIPFYDFVIKSTVSKHDRSSYLGKKQIIQEVAPFLLTIKNPIVRDANVKSLASVLDLDEDAVIQGLKAPGEAVKVVDTASHSTVAIDNNPQYDKTTKQFPLEEYMLALLLKAPLGTAQALTHKLGKKDFTSEVLQKIFIDLKEYLTGRKRRMDINSFLTRFDEGTVGIIQKIYLIDIGKAEEDENLFFVEIEKTFKRLKQRTIKLELKEVTRKIKEAEKLKDTESLQDLLSRLKDLSARLA